MFVKILHSNLRALSTWGIILALLLRVYGLSVPAQPYDIGTYHSWGNHLINVGPQQFFGSIWSDYLPLPILTFSLPTLLASLTGLDFSLVFKLFHTLLELILILSITKTLPKSFQRWGLTLLLLSPATIGNTSYWGQVDAIPSLLSLLALVLIQYRQGRGSAVWYGLAVAYKPIMILISPLLWLAASQKGRVLSFPLISGLVFFATALPFVSKPWDAISFMWQRAIDQAGTYPYLSINAWNIWTITAERAWIPDNIAILGISGHTLGLILFFLGSYLLVKRFIAKGRPLSDLAPLSTLILITFYTVTTRMHERHLLFGLPFLALSLLASRHLFWPYLVLAVSYSLNLYGAYRWVMDNQSWPFPPMVIQYCSWLNILTLLHLFLTYLFPSYLHQLIGLIRKYFFHFLIILLALLLRFINLSHPPAYIFDEVYHAFTAKQYLHGNVEAWQWWTTPPPGVAYEWTHPPVAKYGMVLGMLILGENELGYRIFSAVMGVFAVILLMQFLNLLTHNKTIALLGGLLLAIEGTHLAQSRVAMNDSYMVTFYLASLVAALKNNWKTAALYFGLAMGSKWSAIYGLLPLSYLYLTSHISTPHLNFSSLARIVLSAIRYLLITFSTYILTFTPFILAGHTWSQWWELHRQMWYYHTNLVATHAYQSTPLQWIFGARPVWYWVEYGTGVISNIYVQGNPIILWFGLTAALSSLIFLRHRTYQLLLLLYAVFTLPWLISPRIMFYYHYLPSAVFLTAILALSLARLSNTTRYLILLLSLLGFIYIIPLLYGLPYSTQFWDIYFSIFPTWK